MTDQYHDLSKYSVEEAFALTADRPGLVAKLVPGQRDTFFYGGLLLLDQIAHGDAHVTDMDAHMDAARASHRDSTQWRELKARFALLKYDLAQSSDEGADFLAYLTDTYGITYPSQIPEPSGEAPDPDAAAAAPASSAPSVFVQPERESLYESEYAGVSIGAFKPAAYPWLLAKLAGASTRDEYHALKRVLEQLPSTAVDGTLDALLHHMASEDYGASFASYSALTSKLTLAQLDELLDRRPQLRDDSAFVDTYLTRLHPGADVNLAYALETGSPAAHAYLDVCLAFARTLAPVFNPIRYTLLATKLSLALKDNVSAANAEDLLMELLAIPSSASWVNRDWVSDFRDAGRQGGYVSSSSSSVPGVPAPSSSSVEALVEHYLRDLIADAGRTAPYHKYVRSETLDRWLAEEKLYRGGSADDVEDVLSSSRIKSLRDAVEIAYAPHNASHYEPGSDVVLHVTLKNVAKVLVRVYEVNTGAVYRDSLSPVSEHLSVEGLVPNAESVHEFDRPPMIRSVESLPVPSIGSSRGVYIVELVGGGQCLRAILHIGSLYALTQLASTGSVVRVYNEANELVSDATARLDGHMYSANAHGEILIPFSQSPGSRTLVLASGPFHTLASFYHHGEAYNFTAAFYVDRESLLSKRTAHALVRASLTVNGLSVPVSRVHGVSLTVITTDIDGTSSTHVEESFVLHDDAESVYGFVVPDKTTRVELRLSGRVRVRASESETTVSASKAFQLNAIDLTDAMDDIFLRRSASGYSLVVLGKSGRPRPGRALTVRLEHIDVSATTVKTLATDADGAIDLGPLPNVRSVQAKGSRWTLHVAQGTMARVLNGSSDDVFSVAYHGPAAAVDGYAIACVERNGVGAIVRDVTAQAVTLDAGLVSVSGLTPGDYTLLLLNSAAEFDQISIRVAAPSLVVTFSHQSSDRSRVIVSPSRIVQQNHEAAPVAVAGVDVTDAGVVVRVTNARPTTRVHAVFSHFVPNYDMAGLLGAGSAFFTQSGDSPVDVTRTSASYHSARALSQEHQYILNRKYATKRPGNMLKRPSLLLTLNDNPGNVDNVRRFVNSSGSLRNAMGLNADECEDEDMMYERCAAPSMSACGQQRRRSKKMARDTMGGRGGPMMKEARSLARQELSATAVRDILTNPFRHNMEILPSGSAVHYNMRPGPDGTVTLPLASSSDGRSVVTVVVVDGDSYTARQVAAPVTPAVYNDMRLLNPLDAAAHFAEAKAIDVLAAGDVFAVADRRTTETMAYDSLAKVYALYATLQQGAPGLETFRFLTTWGDLDQDAKLAHYATHASHELNLFVAHKDRPFFDAVVAPFLANKKVKTFVDDYLLGADLSKWAVARKFERLNIVEKILLGTSTGDRTVLQHVIDQADLLPPARGAFNALHKIALKAKLESAAELSSAAGPSAPLGAGASSVSSSYDNVATRRYYAPLPGTVEYGENNYHKVKIEDMDERLVTINKFWGAYAQHCLAGLDAAGSGSPPRTTLFLSEHFVHAYSNPTESVLALAVLDLPYSSPDHKITMDGPSAMTFTATSGLIMVHKQVQVTEVADSPILVCQNFFDPADRYSEVNNERVEKFVTDEFVVNKVYGCQVAVTNVSTARQKVDILEQIPYGAVPLCGGFFTRSHYIELSSYATVTDSFKFYFPASGPSPHFPIHVAQNETTVAVAEPVTLNVVDVPSVHDTLSWGYLVKYGTTDEVVAFLDENNPLRYPITDVANRLGNETSWRKIMDVLQRHKAYVHDVWKFGIKHGDREAVREWLMHNDAFIDRLNSTSNVPFLAFDPEGEVRYQHLEYEPVVNPRAFAMPGRNKGVEPAVVASQYSTLLQMLRYRPQFDMYDTLPLTYYLLLQDRVDEAYAFFSQAATAAGDDDAYSGDMALQVDYFKCYFDVVFGAESGYAVARAVAARYTDYPVKRWRTMFTEVLKQLAEVDDPSSAAAALSTLARAGTDDAEDREAQMAALAATEPSVDFVIQGSTGVVSYQNVPSVTVNYYLMDIELLFSSNPFVAAASKNVLVPNHAETHEIAAQDMKNGTLRFPIAADFVAQNVLVEVVCGSVVRSASYFAQSFQVHVIENYGQLRVVLPPEAGSTPLVGAYVKVYARTTSGSVKFWRDGMTDMRGAFDYATISGGDVGSVSEFAILVMTDDHGCVVKNARSPRT